MRHLQMPWRNSKAKPREGTKERAVGRLLQKHADHLSRSNSHCCAPCRRALAWTSHPRRTNNTGRHRGSVHAAGWDVTNKYWSQGLGVSLG
jgi:hypothetical protein